MSKQKPTDSGMLKQKPTGSGMLKRKPINSGMSKRKPTDSGMSVNFTPPKRRSRRVPITPDSSSLSQSSTINNSPVVPSLNNTTNNPELATSLYSSVSYRVLLPNDIFCSTDGSDVVLVVDMESHGFRRSIAQYLDDTVQVDHSMKQDGLVKYQFPIKIAVFVIRDLVSNGSLDDRDQVLRYNQGDGLTLVSKHGKYLKYFGCFKDLFTGRIQLYEKVSS